MTDDIAGPVEDTSPAAVRLAREIRRLRVHAKLSQARLANVIGYTPAYVSLAERPGKGLPSATLVRAIDAALDANGDLIALGDQAREEQRAMREVVTNSANSAVAWGLSRLSMADPGLDMDPAQYLDHTVAPTPVPQQLGWIDVENVRLAVRAAAAAENMFGGGLSCESALAQLRWAGKLLGVRATNDVRRAMVEAIGNLSSVAAFSAFDIADYVATDRCFRFALWCASESESWALRANTLAEMARKAAYLGHYDDALSLIEFAQGRADRVTATTRAMLWTVRAQLLALIGRHADAMADVERADEYFHHSDPAKDPPWISYYTFAEHQGSTGKALLPVARAERRAELARSRLGEAIDAHGEEFPRSRAFSQVRLATLEMSVGDPAEAARIGRDALEQACGLRSRRLTKELDVLAETARAHTGQADVADLYRDLTRRPTP